jgi:hypothetical protein
VLRFNGGLFDQGTALPLTDEQIGLLIDSGRKQWREVEPAIFGTLLERALDKNERHKLGAHFTPRAYVERLVLPTIVEPLREQWSNVQAAAVTLAKGGQLPEARKEVSGFLDDLCNTTILDPACGTANFLYVAMEHMKRLEGEVRDMLHSLGETQTVFEGTGHSVDPHQFLGIEINPRAAAIAELVLWIGYLQWHFRTFGAKMPAEPIIKPFHNIECRDAVLEYDGKELVLDEGCKPVTRWNGVTFKKHSVTGEKVPDESARTILYRYKNPMKAPWPKADFVVGNPPYIGNKRMRLMLGDGYAEALRSAWKDVSETVDLVMYWWQNAAFLALEGKIRRFGFITTNSITQPFNRSVLHSAREKGLSLVFAIPDHPWVDSTDGAAVRVAITVAEMGAKAGRLLIVAEENERPDESIDVRFDLHRGVISSTLTLGSGVANVVALKANQSLAFRGVTLVGDGFVVSQDEAERLGLGRDETMSSVIREFRNGRDFTDKPRNVYAIDLFGSSEEEVRERWPVVYQHVLERVKPARDQVERAVYREKWWVFGEPRSRFRKALLNIKRYIVSPMTAKHRVFMFVTESVLCDQGLIAIASDDPFLLGVLSSPKTSVIYYATIVNIRISYVRS